MKRTLCKVIANSTQNFVLKSCVPMGSSHFVSLWICILGDVVGGLKNIPLTRSLCGARRLALTWEQRNTGPCSSCGTAGRGFCSPRRSPPKSRERFSVSCQQQKREPHCRLGPGWICMSPAARVRAILAVRPRPAARHSEGDASAKTKESRFTWSKLSDK